MNVLVTGATGYIGGRVVKRLIAEGDLAKPDTLWGALEGVEAAYCLARDAMALAGAEGAVGADPAAHRPA